MGWFNHQPANYGCKYDQICRIPKTSTLLLVSWIELFRHHSWNPTLQNGCVFFGKTWKLVVKWMLRKARIIYIYMSHVYIMICMYILIYFKLPGSNHPLRCHTEICRYLNYISFLVELNDQPEAQEKKTRYRRLL